MNVWRTEWSKVLSHPEKSNNSSTKKHHLNLFVLVSSNNKSLDHQDKVQCKTAVLKMHRLKRAYLVASIEIQQLVDAGDGGEMSRIALVMGSMSFTKHQMKEIEGVEDGG